MAVAYKLHSGVDYQSTSKVLIGLASPILIWCLSTMSPLYTYGCIYESHAAGPARTTR
jgi:hypothetical protein